MNKGKAKTRSGIIYYPGFFSSFLGAENKKLEVYPFTRVITGAKNFAQRRSISCLFLEIIGQISQKTVYFYISIFLFPPRYENFKFKK